MLSIPADRVYRTSAAYVAMTAWTIFITAAFASIVVMMPERMRHEGASVLYASGAVVAVFGPLSLVFYLIRRSRDFVQIDQEKGLIVRGRDLIPWEDIHSIEARPGLLGRQTQKEPVRLSSSGGVLKPESFSETLDRAVLGSGPRQSGGVILFCLLMPIIAIFTPWHPKVIVVLKTRRRIVFDELDRDIEFALRCAPKVREQRGKRGRSR